MTLPDMLLIDGVEYRRADRDAPEAKDRTDGHGPLPWTSTTRHIGSADGLYVCECPGRDSIGQRAWDANCFLILRAVNHHAELLAFVERVARFKAECICSNCVELSPSARELLDKVKA
jgi:hypothetical protein